MKQSGCLHNNINYINMKQSGCLHNINMKQSGYQYKTKWMSTQYETKWMSTQQDQKHQYETKWISTYVYTTTSKISI